MKDQIPDNLYRDLIDEYGVEKANQIIDENDNIIVIIKILTAHRLGKKLGFKITWTTLMNIILAIVFILWILSIVTY